MPTIYFAMKIFNQPAQQQPQPEAKRPRTRVAAPAPEPAPTPKPAAKKAAPPAPEEIKATLTPAMPAEGISGGVQPRPKGFFDDGAAMAAVLYDFAAWAMKNSNFIVADPTRVVWGIEGEIATPSPAPAKFAPKASKPVPGVESDLGAISASIVGLHNTAKIMKAASNTASTVKALADKIEAVKAELATVTPQAKIVCPDLLRTVSSEYSALTAEFAQVKVQSTPVAPAVATGKQALKQATQPVAVSAKPTTPKAKPEVVKPPVIEVTGVKEVDEFLDSLYYLPSKKKALEAVHQIDAEDLPEFLEMAVNAFSEMYPKYDGWDLDENSTLDEWVKALVKFVYDEWASYTQPGE